MISPLHCVSVEMEKQPMEEIYSISSGVKRNREISNFFI